MGMVQIYVVQNNLGDYLKVTVIFAENEISKPELKSCTRFFAYHFTVIFF